MRGTNNANYLKIAAACVTMTGTARAADFTWVNAAGGNWSVASNWGGTVPVSASTTVLNFNTVNATYTATNDLGTTAAAPFVLNAINFGITGTPTVAGGFLDFQGTNPTITKASGGGAPVLSSVINVGNGLTLTVAGNATDAMSISGQITGAGALNVTGGSLSLSSANSTLAGGMTLTGGEIVVFGDSTLSGSTVTKGPIGTGTLRLNGGSIRTNSGNARTVSNALTLGGNVGLAGSSGNNLTFAGPTTITGTGATRTLTIVGTKVATFAGAIGDGGAGNGLTIASSAAGTLTLGGGAADVAANTYTGATTVNTATGIVILDKASGTNAIAGDLVYQAGTLTLNRANQIADTSNVTINGTGTLNFGVDETVGSVSQSSGAFRVNGGNTTTVASTYTLTGGTGPTLGGTLAVGGLNVTRPAAGTAIYEAVTTNNGITAGTLKLNGNVTVNASANAFGTRIRQGGAGGSLDLNGAQRTFNVGDGAAVEDLIVSAAVIDSGTGGGFRKTGLGTLALTNDASATVTGVSAVDAGTLAVYNFAATPTAGLGATGSGLLTVSGGATLAGNGKVAGVTVGGTVDPSVPSATNLGGTYSATPQLVVSAATFITGGTLKLDGIGSAASDKLVIGGLLNLAAIGDRLVITGTVDNSSSYVLASYGSLSGLFDQILLNGSALPANYAVAYTSASGPGDVVLQLQAVPEPTTMALFALGGVALLGRRRR